MTDQVNADPCPFIINGEDIRLPKKLTNIKVVEFYISANDRKHQNPSTVAAWLNAESKQAIDAGWENLHVEIGHDTDEWDHPVHDYIRIYGDRIETPKETKDRVHHELIRWRRDREKWEQERKYYESDYGKARLETLEKYR